MEENLEQSSQNPTLYEKKEDNVGENQQDKVDDISALKSIKYKVISFIDTHQYTSIAVGTGLLVGCFLVAKHFIKRR